MPAVRNPYVAKLVSADQLVKYIPMTNGHRQEYISNRFVMPLRPTTELADPLDSMQVRQRTYRVYDQEYNERLRCLIVEYREVL